MIYLGVTMWMVSGIVLGIWLWTITMDMIVGDVPLLMLYGAIAGPLMGLLWLYSSWASEKPFAKRVLIKRRR